jgi:hypothetical protein
MSATTATSAEPLKRRKLPIGIQTFRQIREGNCYYALMLRSRHLIGSPDEKS